MQLHGNSKRESSHVHMIYSSTLTTFEQHFSQHFSITLIAVEQLTGIMSAAFDTRISAGQQISEFATRLEQYYRACQKTGIKIGDEQ
jgi:hypothetical protein